MSDRDVVVYCIVDTRAWLRDPAPLFATNVESLRRVLDVAAEADLFRFVYCSTVGTVAIANDDTPLTEDTPFNWDGKGGPYTESRRRGEDLVLVCERAWPACGRDVRGHSIRPARLAAKPGHVRADVRFRKNTVVPQQDRHRGSRSRGCGRSVLACRGARADRRYIVSETYMSMRE